MNSIPIDATMVFGFVTGVLNVLKPYIEALPFARPSNKPMHDSTLRIANYVLNVAGVGFLTYWSGTATDPAAMLRLAPSILIWAAMGAFGSHLIYQSTPAPTPQDILPGLNVPKVTVPEPPAPPAA